VKKIITSLGFLFGFLSLFAQEYDGIERNFYSYKLNLIDIPDFTIYNDTTLNRFHNFLPQQKISFNNLGFQNPGNPVISAVFSDNNHQNVFCFLNNYYPFIKTHEDVVYFDTKKSFTLFTFNGGTKKMDNTGFFHTQNLGSCFNFALKYDVVNSEGQYMYNKAKVHALSFNTSFTKRKYQSHFNLILNKVDHNENGGLAEDKFTTSKISEGNLETNLKSSDNKISQFGVQYNQELRFGHYFNDTLFKKNDTIVGKILQSKFSIMHDITFDKFYRIYTDNSSDYYQNYYYSNESRDSTTLLFLNNKLLLNLNIESNKKLNKFQILAGLKNNLYKYSFPDTTKMTKNSTFLTGILLLETNKNKLFVELNYGLFGWEIFDLEVKARDKFIINDKINLSAYFNYELNTPDIFYSYYSSNNFQWKNDSLKKTNSTKVGLKVNFEKIFLNFGTNINLLHNYFVFDYEAMPVQISKANFIFDIYAEKTFKLKNFYWFTQLTYQFISDKENLPLPQFLGYTSFYYQRPLFKNALLLQVGIDCKFSSAIYGYGYMPATGVFYLQNENKFGNYPNIGAFFEAKIKRFRGFVKVSNVSSFVMKRNFYLLDKIPDNPFAFSFGISWEFYD
jgi:hypothetical protein